MAQNSKSNTNGILNQFNRGMVAPPWIMTVAMTIKDVVVNIICLASDIVLRMASAKDIAPLKPTTETVLLKNHVMFVF